MEHATITEISDKLRRITPDEGYILLNTATNTTHSDAVVEDWQVEQFRAIAIDAES